MSKNKKVETYDHWWCETCNDGKCLERHEMFDHLEAKHGIKPSDVKGKQQMLMHADGADFFKYSWRVTVDNPSGGEIVLTNNTCDERPEESKMYWM